MKTRHLRDIRAKGNIPAVYVCKALTSHCNTLAFTNHATTVKYTDPHVGKGSMGVEHAKYLKVVVTKVI